MKFALTGVALSLLAGTAASETVFQASNFLPASHIVSKTQAKWCEMLAMESAGRMRCTIAAQPFTPASGIYDAVRDGKMDISVMAHGNPPGRFTLPQMAEMPLLGANSEAISVAYTRVASRHPAFANEQPGVKLLALFTHGPGQIYNIRKLTSSVSDAQGLKLRVGAGLVNEVTKTLGATPVYKPAPEAAELMAKGDLDGVMFPAESVEAFKVDRLVKFGTNVPGGVYNTSFAFIMNQDKYNQLSAEDRRVIDKISGESAARMFGRGWDDQDRKGMAYMQVAGVKFVQPDAKFMSDLRTRLAPLEQQWIQQAEAKGLTGAKNVLAEFRGEISKMAK